MHRNRRKKRRPRGSGTIGPIEMQSGMLDYICELKAFTTFHRASPIGRDPTRGRSTRVGHCRFVRFYCHCYLFFSNSSTGRGALVRANFLAPQHTCLFVVFALRIHNFGGQGAKKPRQENPIHCKQKSQITRKKVIIIIVYRPLQKVGPGFQKTLLLVTIARVTMEARHVIQKSAQSVQYIGNAATHGGV